MRPKKYLGLHKVLGQKILPQKNIRSEKNFGSEKIFWSDKNFGSGKKFWVQNLQGTALEVVMIIKVETGKLGLRLISENLSRLSLIGTGNFHDGEAETH